jgi:hypothetical protein
MLRFQIKQWESYTMIADIFVQGKTNFLYGPSGVGKTVGTIKALNRASVTPILLDFDDNLNPDELGLEAIVVDGNKFANELFKQIKDGDVDLSIPPGSVIIVDTYKMIEQYEELFKAEFKQRFLEYLRPANKNVTVIVIGHSLDLATRRDIPDAPSDFVNHCASKLFLAPVKHKMEKKTVTLPTLEVMKLRGYNGKTILINWMRD